MTLRALERPAAGEAEGAPFLPIAIVHGTYDPVIPVQFAHAARALLEEAGAEPLYRELPIEHWIDPAVLPELRTLVSGVSTV